GLTRFLEDGRLELDTNPVENAIRPVCLTRKNALFAGHDEGAIYCSSVDCLINQEHFDANHEATGAVIAWHRLHAGPCRSRYLRSE
ncbi:transposase, partial [Bradyrhizobium sp. S3.2.6]|uniref:IS66 family transposase n=1 Tax=Bradyrhizobium sp. S3.2.6 TaxID=3156428 RepID=UPI00339082F4